MRIKLVSYPYMIKVGEIWLRCEQCLTYNVITSDSKLKKLKINESVLCTFCGTKYILKNKEGPGLFNEDYTWEMEEWNE